MKTSVRFLSIVLVFSYAGQSVADSGCKIVDELIVCPKPTGGKGPSTLREQVERMLRDPDVRNLLEQKGFVE